MPPVQSGPETCKIRVGSLCFVRLREISWNVVRTNTIYEIN